jgi:hypothetical protein
MTDPRIRDYLGKSDEAAKTRPGGQPDNAQAARGTRSTNSTGHLKLAQAATAHPHGSSSEARPDRPVGNETEVKA